MSDPVSNVEIEDVLSSIRRLVSEDARVRPLPVRLDAERLADYAEVEGASAPHDKAEKLVLTPALRVADPSVDDGAGDAPDTAQEARLHDGDTEAQPDEAIGNAAPDSLADDTTDQPIVHETAQSDSLDPDDASQTLTWEDLEGEASPAAPVSEADTSDNFLSDIMDMVGDTPAPAADDAKDGGDFIFASTRDDPRPAPADRSKDMAADDKAASQSLFEDEETFLDEETLREMVADIVRQELQGALGERITRNVRKLVRREIHRALTSHELD